jgi:hypothetical protein
LPHANLGNMTKIFKFLYFTIIFCFLFLVATNDVGKLLLSLSNFFFCFILNILFNFSYIFLLLPVLFIRNNLKTTHRLSKLIFFINSPAKIKGSKLWRIKKWFKVALYVARGLLTGLSAGCSRSPFLPCQF